MKKTIVIVGGNAGAVISSEIFRTQYKEILYLETYSLHINQSKVIGNQISDGLIFLNKKDVDYFIATGDNNQREINFKQIYKQTEKEPVNCIHETAYLSPSVKIGYGNLICAGSIVHTEATIGNNTIINTGSIVEHNCIINDYAQISPNATLCGYVIVGKSAFVGAGSVVIPKMSIGKHSIVGAGAAVTSNVGNNVLYAGVPAREKKKL